MYFSLSSMFLIFLHVLLHFYDEDTWRRICLCSCEYVGTVKPPCECMCGRKKWPGPARVLPNTLLSLLEPCLAVILKKSELRTDGGGSPRLFFSVFSLFLWYFSSFFCVRVLQLRLFCGMDNIDKRDSRERQKKYTTYITLCYEQNINL